MASKLTLEDIMAPIIVIFKQRIANLIKVGKKGRVLFIRKNEALGEDVAEIKTYMSAIFELDDKVFEKQIKNIFGNGVKEVITLEYSGTFSKILLSIKKIGWDWMFSTDEDTQTDVASYCKENKKFGFVYNLKSDSMYVVSINNPSAVLADDTDTEITAMDLLPIVAGVIAGCPYDKSVSYKIFDVLKSVELPDEITAGQLTLYNEEEGVRVASPLNTLVTLGENITEDMKSIAIVEGMKRLEIDITYAYRTGYKGKYKNTYNNQCLFFSAVNYYLEQLEELRILDPEYENTTDTNIEKQRQMWIAVGKNKDEINSMSDIGIKKLTFKNIVYPRVNTKFLDAMEGMEMEVEMY